MTHTEMLGTAIAKEMRKISEANQKTLLDFGTLIGEQLDLETDRLRRTIPAGSYTILHDMRKRDLPPFPCPCGECNCPFAEWPDLEAGDRVLVAWVGNEPVVLGRIV